MGLDSMWSGSVEGNFDLCGGMFSGHGNDSFRGKVYIALVEAITGVSLYQEEIPNSTVVEMGRKLGEVPLSDVRKFDPDIPHKEFCDLVTMFQSHGRAGHVLRGWW